MGQGRAGRPNEEKAELTGGPRGIYPICFIRERNVMNKRFSGRFDRSREGARN